MEFGSVEPGSESEPATGSFRWQAHFIFAGGSDEKPGLDGRRMGMGLWLGRVGRMTKDELARGHVSSMSVVC